MQDDGERLCHGKCRLDAAVLAERDTLVARNAALEASNATLATTNATLESANERLEQILAEIRRAHFGRKSERITADQLALALEELETAAAHIETTVAKSDPARKTERARKPRAGRHDDLDHLPHEEIVIEPESKVCSCCGGELHKIRDDITEQLDVVPMHLRVIATNRVVARNDKNQPEYLIALFEDITDKREMAHELEDTPMRGWTDDFSDILAPFLSKMKR